MSDFSTVTRQVTTTAISGFVAVTVAVVSVFLLVAGHVNAAEVVDPTRPGNWKPPVAVVKQAPKPIRKVAPVLPAEPLVLSGLMTGVAGSSALINGHWVQTGEQVAGATVLSIESGSVLVMQRGRRITLGLSGSMTSAKGAASLGRRK